MTDSAYRGTIQWILAVSGVLILLLASYFSAGLGNNAFPGFFIAGVLTWLFQAGLLYGHMGLRFSKPDSVAVLGTILGGIIIAGNVLAFFVGYSEWAKVERHWFFSVWYVWIALIAIGTSYAFHRSWGSKDHYIRVRNITFVVMGSAALVALALIPMYIETIARDTWFAGLGQVIGWFWTILVALWSLAPVAYLVIFRKSYTEMRDGGAQAEAVPADRDPRS